MKIFFNIKKLLTFKRKKHTYSSKTVKPEDWDVISKDFDKVFEDFDKTFEASDKMFEEFNQMLKDRDDKFK